MRTRTLALIAAFKLVEALLALLVALGAFGMLDARVAAMAQQWVLALAASYDARLVERLIAFFTGLVPHRLAVIGVAALAYAALFALEGIGLWRGRRWAEYLTVVITGSLVPFEVYELVRRTTPVRAGALALNVAIVAYLVWSLRRDAHHPASSASIGPASADGSSVGA